MQPTLRRGNLFHGHLGRASWSGGIYSVALPGPYRMDGDTFPRFTSHYSYSLPCACTLVLPYLAAGGRKLDRPAGKSCYIQMQQRARTRPPDCRAWWYFWQEARTRPYTGTCRSRQSLFLRDRRSWWPHRVGAHGQASSCSGSGVDRADGNAMTRSSHVGTIGCIMMHLLCIWWTLSRGLRS